ncbi:hypothetical protein P280DRAFT_529016 [Massarina eburnea CBS 473.64]|uniref:Uncharacterized protein n=1 Tax=Massarina eburnea CBS 473.64 TaxID=1395130 RepID=A0A6A6RRT5_9PLEO|nr:hypothetical protein P280DRAFT_529016 [Massarina eburnea CBS 473.64]
MGFSILTMAASVVGVHNNGMFYMLTQAAKGNAYLKSTSLSPSTRSEMSRVVELGIRNHAKVHETFRPKHDSNTLDTGLPVNQQCEVKKVAHGAQVHQASIKDYTKGIGIDAYKALLVYTSNAVCLPGRGVLIIRPAMAAVKYTGNMAACQYWKSRKEAYREAINMFNVDTLPRRYYKIIDQAMGSANRRTQFSTSLELADINAMALFKVPGYGMVRLQVPEINQIKAAELAFTMMAISLHGRRLQQRALAVINSRAHKDGYEDISTDESTLPGSGSSKENVSNGTDNTSDCIHEAARGIGHKRKASEASNIAQDSDGSSRKISKVRSRVASHDSPATIVHLEQAEPGLQPQQNQDTVEDMLDYSPARNAYRPNLRSRSDVTGDRVSFAFSECIQVLKKHIPILQQPQIHDGYFVQGEMPKGSFHFAQFITVREGDAQGTYIIKVPKSGHWIAWREEDSNMFRSDAHTMAILEYLRPLCRAAQVVGYDHTNGPTNVLGFPYVVMRAAEGVSAFRLLELHHIPVEERMARFTTFVKSLAFAMSQLHSLRFDRTGCPQISDDAKHVFTHNNWSWLKCSDRVDQLVSEPTFRTDKSFWLHNLDNSIPWVPNPETDEHKVQNGKRVLMEQIVKCLTDMSSGGFTIKHADLDLQNCIVNEETGELSAIIDWDGARAVPRPIGCTAQPLFLAKDYFARWQMNCSFLSLGEIEYFRQVWAKTMVELLGPDSDAKFSLNSPLYQSAYAALFGDAWGWQDCDHFLKTFLREIPELKRHDPIVIFYSIGGGRGPTNKNEVGQMVQRAMAPKLPDMC